jgi:uncharacterized membrane protein YheB (UPF0754 family)
MNNFPLIPKKSRMEEMVVDQISNYDNAELEEMVQNVLLCTMH